MTLPHALKTAGQGLAVGGGLAALGYAALVAFHRTRYGRVAYTCSMGDDSKLLDRFIPSPEVVEHHRSRISAPADVVLSTAKEMDLLTSTVIRIVVKARQIVLGGQPGTPPHPRALLSQLQSIGWVVLAERTGREIVLGAVTQPWQATVVFRPIPAADFAAFREPGYVKIASTLRAEAIGAHQSMVHTETRLSTTDLQTQARFRRYWSFVAPGIKVITLSMVRSLRRSAERRAAAAAAQAWTGGAGAEGSPKRVGFRRQLNA